MSNVTVTTGKVHYRTNIKIRNHELIADEPEDVGGKNEGPTATELLLSSLGTCSAVTLRMYADRKQWPLESVDITLDIDKNTEAGELISTITKKITLSGDLDNDQRERLLLIADKCPVHKVLMGNIEINSSLS